jgi:hypothetical protein
LERGGKIFLRFEEPILVKSESITLYRYRALSWMNNKNNLKKVSLKREIGWALVAYRAISKVLEREGKRTVPPWRSLITTL